MTRNSDVTMLVFILVGFIGLPFFTGLLVADSALAGELRGQLVLMMALVFGSVVWWLDGMRGFEVRLAAGFFALGLALGVAAHYIRMVF